MSDLKDKFVIPPISKKANLVNMPDEYFEFYRYIINNYWGKELEVSIKVLSKTEEREIYDG